MSNIKIQDVDQRVQYTATPGQTVFSVPFPFFDKDDLVVYKDTTKLTRGGGASEYTVSGAGSPSGGSITLNTGASSGEIITIYDDLAIDRTSIYSATISNLTGASLNQDFNREVVMMQQIDTTQRLLQLQYAPYAEVDQDDTVTTDRWIPILSSLEAWRMNQAGTAIETFTTPASGGLAPNDATYITQTSNSELTSEQAIGDLASGFLVGTNSTGVVLSRTLTVNSSELSLSNGTGIGGNPVFGMADNPKIPGSEGVTIPAGTTAERPTSPTTNRLRFNTDLGQIEFFNSTTSAWEQLEDSANFPTTSTDNAIARFDGTGGKLQNSGVLINDLNQMSGVTRLDVDNIRIDGNTISSTDTNGDITLLPDGSGVTQVLSDLDMNANNLLDVTRLDFNTSWRIQDETVGGIQRLLLRAQTGNEDAELALVPIGTATASRFILTDNSSLTNFSSLELSADASANQVNSAKDGSGTLKPLELAMDDTAAFEIKTSGTPGAKSNRIEDVADPTGDQDAATKAYVDGKTDLYFMNSVKVASTSNFASTYDNGSSGIGATLTASSNGAASIDGVSLSLNDRVLFKDQTAAEENGLYYVSQVGDGSNPAIYTRTTDYDVPELIDPGDVVPVLQGTDNASTSWLQTATVSTIGTDSITFSQFTADFSNVVTIDGTQTITGSKTFSSGTFVDGSADEVQFKVQGHSTQTSNIWEVEDSGGLTLVSLDDFGNLDVALALRHVGDTTNQHLFGSSTQEFQTSGSNRMDISDSGVRLGGANARVTTTLDEDDMASDSATALSTQQAIKAYIDRFNLSNENALVNSTFRVAQLGTTFDSTTTPANNDDTYLFDQWILLSDGNDVVDVTRTPTDGVGNNYGIAYAIKNDIETANKQFGWVQLIESQNDKWFRNTTFTLMVSLNTGVSNTTLENVRIAIIGWDGTVNSMTSDVVSTWNGGGTNPTLATNWSYLSTPGTITVPADTDAHVYTTTATLGGSGETVNNLGVFIWIDDTDATVGDLLNIGGAWLLPGDIPISSQGITLANAGILFPYRSMTDEIAMCERYYQKSYNLDDAPASTTGEGSLGYRNTSTGASLATMMRTLQTRMRDTPAVTWYATVSGTKDAIRNVDTVGDETVSSTSSAGQTLSGNPVLSSASTSGDRYYGHFTADARL